MNKSFTLTIAELEDSLNNNIGNLDSIANLFTEHVASDFINRYIEDELFELSNNESLSPSLFTNKADAYLINNDSFDYSIHVYGPRKSNANIKWMNIRQILAIKGQGSLLVRLLKLPKDIDINHFERNIKYSILEEKTFYDGDLIYSLDPFNIIEIAEVKSSVLVESLSIKGRNTELYWNFDIKNESYFSEYSNSSMSRISNVIDLSNNINYSFPPKLIASLYESCDSNIKLKVIEKLLIEEDQDAFNYLDLAINSEYKTLSNKSKSFLNMI